METSQPVPMPGTPTQWVGCPAGIIIKSDTIIVHGAQRGPGLLVMRRARTVLICWGAGEHDQVILDAGAEVQRRVRS